LFVRRSYLLTGNSSERATYPRNAVWLGGDDGDGVDWHGVGG
jgi:hypothetical protein